MKTKIFLPTFLLAYSLSFSQSSMVFDTGTTIEVTGSADICADVVTINGSYSGDGTKCNSPLPVELISFNVKCIMQNVELNWTTATEVNNFGFEIERKLVGTELALSENNWQKIGFVSGHGNSNSPKDYSFIDKNPFSGKIKYRLKQIDTDGSFSYSNEVEVNVEVPKEFTLEQNYPNPFGKTIHSDNPTTKISWQSPVSGWQTLKVYDLLGKEVATLVNEFRQAGRYEIEFNPVESRGGVSLPSGVYFYRIEIHSDITQAGSFVQIRKMLLAR